MSVRNRKAGYGSTGTTQPYLVDVMSSAQKLKFRLLTSVWVLALLWFWNWWLHSDHVVTWIGFVITSFVLSWSTLMPAWYFYFAGRMKRPNPALPLPAGRVAMVVTKAPAEPWPLVRNTLEAMISQDFPGHYDVWLADEDPGAETLAWCALRNVRVSCRKEARAYHNAVWPRRTKCKEGNLAYFYDRVGYKRYDFVAQLDADHAPEPSYLRHMVEPFRDPRVGYVAAPSICDANKDKAWTVRARLYAEAPLHGSLRAGYGSPGWAPICIGSHYAVRTSALRRVGGLGPELAEDYSTSLIFNNAGWNGAFAIDAIAHGEGPASLADFATQEFQWARSLTNILLVWFGRFSKGLTFRKRLQFLFAAYWYPTYAGEMVIAILSPALALLLRIPWVSVNYWDFLWRFWALSAVCILPIWWIRNQGWFRPQSAPPLSWETVLFQIVRWPWVIAGVAASIADALSGGEFKFRVTPKGAAHNPLGVVAIVPYLLIGVGSALVAALVGATSAVEGYRFLAVVDASIYTLALVAMVLLHVRENARDPRSVSSAVPGMIAGSGSIALVFVAIVLAIPRVSPVLALSPRAAPTPKAQLVAVRPQLGPTPVPTADTNPLMAELPTIIPIFPTPTPLPVIELPEKAILTGMYDPGLTFSDVRFDIKHRFTNWNNPDEIDQAIDAAQEARQFPMLTIQPFHKPGSPVDTLLQDIAEGKYDSEIRAMATALKRHTPQRVIVRFGHEMDLCQVYEWAKCSPSLFIPAYQRVVDITREIGVNNVSWMWSPAGGNPDTDLFYPGDDYVDLIGITGLESEDWDRYYGYEPQPRYFAQLLNERYGLAPEFNKPLIVAELGISYSDPSVDRSKWLADAFEVMKDREKYPLLAGWVYFNEFTQPNPHINLLPDFRIAREELLQALSTSGGD